MRKQGGLFVQDLFSSPGPLACQALISKQGILHSASGGCAKDDVQSLCCLYAV